MSTLSLFKITQPAWHSLDNRATLCFLTHFSIRSAPKSNTIDKHFLDIQNTITKAWASFPFTQAEFDYVSKGWLPILFQESLSWRPKAWTP